MTGTVHMYAPAGVAEINGNFANDAGESNAGPGVYTVGSDNRALVDLRDEVALMQAGFGLSTLSGEYFSLPKAPAAASATVTVASVALSNGTLTIAALPDVPRPLQFIAGTGTGAVTAGTLTLTYPAVDGSTQVDNFPLSIAGSGTQTMVTSKGCLSLTSPVVAGLAGGTSPWIYGGTTAALAVPINYGATNLTLASEVTDGTSGTSLGTLAAGGIWTPHSAPNGTHVYSAGYSYTAPAGGTPSP